MNSRAGWKLWGRNPAQQPTIAAQIRVATEKTLAGTKARETR